jgi:hypothetical protein
MIASEPRWQHQTCFRGVMVRLSRKNGCVNGKAMIEVTGSVFDHSKLPKSPDIEDFILKMFSKICLQDSETK